MNSIRSAALGLLLTFGAAGVAAAQADSTPPARSHRAGAHARGARAGAQRPRPALRRLFKDVKLTDAQRTQMQAIHEKYAAQNKTIRESMQPAMKDARAARQSGDSAAVKAAIARTADARAQMKTLMDSEMTDTRAILTPEQQKTFDANLAQMKARSGERRGGHHARSGS